MTTKGTIPPDCDVFLPLCHWWPAGLQAGGVGQGIGNVLYAPCVGLACIPITAWRASVPPRAANIWKHSQSKHNLGQVPDWKENKPGSPGSQQREVHWGTQGTRLCLCSSLCCVMGVLWGEDIHLSADPMLWAFAVLRDPLFSAKDLSHGLLSFCSQEGLGILVWNSSLHLFQPPETGLLFPWIRFSSASWVPRDSTQSHQDMDRHFSSQEKPVFSNTSAQPWPTFRHLLQPVERAQHLPEDNSGHALYTLTWCFCSALRNQSVFADIALGGMDTSFLKWYCYGNCNVVQRQSAQCQLAVPVQSSAQGTSPYCWGVFSKPSSAPC